jgi:hypothetical protein
MFAQVRELLLGWTKLYVYKYILHLFFCVYAVIVYVVQNYKATGNALSFGVYLSR